MVFCVVLSLSLATARVASQARRTRRRAAVMSRLAEPRRDSFRSRRVSHWLREPPARLAVELAALDLTLEVRRVWRVWRASVGVALLVGTVLIGIVFGVLLAALAVIAPVAAWLILRSRADAAYDDTLATALDAAARSVRSGGSLPQAVAEAAGSVRGAVSADLVGVATATERGRPFTSALDAWRVARPRPAVRLVVGALALAAHTGGPPARVIEDVAAAVRTRQQVAREAHALAAQARLSAVVVGAAPLAFMVVTCATDRRNAHMLFGTPIGLACVLAGLTLDAIGAWWMHRMSTAVAL